MMLEHKRPMEQNKGVTRQPKVGVVQEEPVWSYQLTAVSQKVWIVGLPSVPRNSGPKPTATFC
jgi:hypothetical protein